MTDELVILDRDDVEALFTPELALDAAARGLQLAAEGRAQVPARTRVEVPGEDADLLVMPGFVPALDALGVKLVGGFPRNPSRGLHGSPGVVLLLNPVTGLATAIVDATHLTDLRTAAVTALAVRTLARPGARTAAIVGTGALARAHARAFAHLLELDEIRVWSRDRANVDAFTSALAGVPATIVPAADLEACTRGAEIVVAATTATRPMLLPGVLGEGATVCGVGSYLSGTAEIHPDVVRAAARVIVDNRAGVLAGPADVAGPVAAGDLPSSAVIELGQVLNGTCGGRTSPNDTIVFKSVGSAVVDLVAAALVVEAARERGSGRRLPAIEIKRGEEAIT